MTAGNTAAKSRRLRRRRAEWAFIVCSVAGHLLLAPLVVDLYPFSTMPMFSDSLRTTNTIQVLDPKGQAYPPMVFGLGSNELANPSPRYGLRPAYSPIRPGGFSADEQLRAIVQPRLRQSGLDLPYVDVVESIIGPQPIESRQTVGVLATRRLRVFREKGEP